MALVSHLLGNGHVLDSIFFLLISRKINYYSELDSYWKHIREFKYNLSLSICLVVSKLNSF